MAGIRNISNLFFFFSFGLLFNLKSFPETDGTENCLKLGMSKMYVREPCKLGRQILKRKHAQTDFLRLSLDFDLRFLLVL